MFSYAVVNPSAMVVILRNADFAYVAVVLARTHFFDTN